MGLNPLCSQCNSGGLVFDCCLAPHRQVFDTWSACLDLFRVFAVRSEDRGGQGAGPGWGGGSEMHFYIAIRIEHPIYQQCTI